MSPYTNANPPPATASSTDPATTPALSHQGSFGLVGVVALTAPWLVAAVAPGQQRYIVHVLIFTMLFAALALSYDLVVGHV